MNLLSNVIIHLILLNIDLNDTKRRKDSGIVLGPSQCFKRHLKTFKKIYYLVLTSDNQ